MKKLKLLLIAVAFLIVFTSSVLAQGSKPEVVGTLEVGWVALAMGVAAVGCGIGQGRVVAGGCESVARNPGAVDTIRFFVILGLAFIEFLGLLTFLIFLLVPQFYTWTPQ